MAIGGANRDPGVFDQPDRLMIEPSISPFFRAIAVLTMATSAGLVPEIAWPFAMLSVEAPMFTGFAGWVDPVKYTCWLRKPAECRVGAQARLTLLATRLMGDVRLVEPSLMLWRSLPAGRPGADHS